MQVCLSAEKKYLLLWWLDDVVVSKVIDLPACLPNMSNYSLKIESSVVFWAGSEVWCFYDSTPL